MFVKRPLLLSVLMLGASTIVLHSQDLGSASDAAPVQAPIFGAPQRPATDTIPASPAELAKPDAPGLTIAARPAATVPSAAWVLERPKPEVAGVASTTAVDVSALRYYAHENDLARVAAEIRLLRAKNPGWEPPEDLFTDLKGGESEQPLWDLLAKHDLEGLKAAMDARRHETPDWQPSTDLASKLASTEAYVALVKASDAKDWGTVIDLASGTRGLMTCANIDAVWRTAEALIRSGDEDHAVEAYRFVLATCVKPDERLATVQKAMALVKSRDAIDGLLQMGKRSAGGASEFEQVRLDRIRQKVGDMAAGKPGAGPAQGELDELEANARSSGGRNDAELLGWLAFSRKDFAQAETWFRTSLQDGPSAKGAEGLVLALRDGGKMPEAQKLAIQYADLDHLNRKLMVEVLSAGLADPRGGQLTPDQDASLAQAIEAEKSADGAQSYGWFRYRANDFVGADAWFRKSAEWQPSESAAVGLVVTAKRLKHESDYAALVAQYRGTYPRIAELEGVLTTTSRALQGGARASHAARSTIARTANPSGGGWDQSATAIVDTFQGGNYEQAMAMLDERKARRRSEPNGLAVVRGWAMYKKGDWEGAKRVFTDLGAKGMSREAQDGIRVIDEGYTNPRYR